MSHENKECLRALAADFIKTNSGGWWCCVPVLLKTCKECNKETVTVPSDEYIQCLESPLGLSTETLV
jgi:hypothetical protein